MSGAMSTRFIELAVDGLVRFLPGYVVQGRYRREFLAELHDLSPRQQIRYLCGVLLSVSSLRRALSQTGSRQLAPVAYRAAIICKVRFAHDWHTDFTEDGQPYRRCHRCGIDSPLGARAPRDGLTYAAQRPL